MLKHNLAVDRTNLAVDRTLLAYLRTFLTIILVGISFIKLFDSSLINFFGWVLMISSVTLFFFGAKRCSYIKNHIK